jgi:hypothetical protein
MVMVQLKRIFYILIFIAFIVFALITLGCQKPNKIERTFGDQQEYRTQENEYENEYFKKLPSDKQKIVEIANAEQIIHLYFEAINEKNYNLVLALFSHGYIKSTSPQNIISGLKEIEKVDKINITLVKEQGNIVEFMVTFNLQVAKNSSGAWRSGSTTRFFTLSNNGSRWQIVQIGSCP